MIVAIISLFVLLLVVCVNIYILVAINRNSSDIDSLKNDTYAKINNNVTDIQNLKDNTDAKITSNIKTLKDDTDKKLTSNIQTLRDDTDAKLNKINLTSSASAESILDLVEFKDLDPYLKDAYKRYIVNILSSAFMKAVNKSASDNDVKKYLTDNQKQIDEMAYSIAKELQTNGLASLQKLYE